MLHRTQLIARLLVVLLMPLGGFAQGDGALPNFVIASDRLHTAGQPSAEQLSRLAERGYDLVVNLAPPTNEHAVETEGKLVSQSGVAYVNIPVDWRSPAYRDFELFSAVLNGAGDRRVLVHCQVNRRASTFTFLYRVVHEHVPPEEAFAAVTQIWVPQPHWAAFANDVLERHGVAFTVPAEP